MLAPPPGTVDSMRAIDSRSSDTRGSIQGSMVSQCSGIRLGGTSTLRRLFAASSTCAKSLRRGCSNNSRMAMSRPRSRKHAISRSASSECPPNSKKLSWRPTRSISSTSHQSAARLTSHSLHGASNSPFPVPMSGSGSAARSSLPLAVNGRASMATSALGIIWSGRW